MGRAVDAGVCGRDIRYRYQYPRPMSAWTHTAMECRVGVDGV